MEALGSVFTAILSGIKPRYKLFVGLAIFVGLIGLLQHVEKTTRLLYLTGLQYRASILSDLNTLAHEGVLTQPELSSTFMELASDLEYAQVTPMELTTLATQLSLKFLTGAAFGLAFLTIAALSGRPGSRQVMKGSLAIAAVFGVVGTILPPILGNLMFNLLLLVLVQLIGLSLVGRMLKARIHDISS